MSEPVSLLMREFLTWVSSRRRTYAELRDAWRTTCPRHSAWEDALADGLVRVERWGPARPSEVVLTPRGEAAFQAPGAEDQLG
jgi:hypothetical protein